MLLGISIDNVHEWAKLAPKTYRKYVKPKHNGGKRTIFHPSKKTKALQYALLELILNKINVHDIAIAYRKNVRSPIRKELESHLEYAYTLRLDMKDFFPSILPEDLSKYLTEFALSDSERQFIINALFVQYKGKIFLGIGAPASPQICNIVMRDIDDRCYEFAMSQKGRICRYADDIIFSSNDKNSCTEFIDFLQKLLKNTDSPKLKLKPNKTRLMSKGNQRKVLGLTITPDKKLSIGRANKRKIKSLILQSKYNSLDKNKLRILKGHLWYIADADPDFLQSLNMKYGADRIAKIMENNHYDHTRII